MSHTYATMQGYRPAGPGWRVAYAVDALVRDVARLFPRVYCVGTKGDNTPQHQTPYSMHYPNVVAPDGLKLVLAVDLDSPVDADLHAIQDRIEALYNSGDARQHGRNGYGFTNMDGQGTVWDNDPHTSYHATGGDYGHLHANIDSNTYPSQPNGYTPAMDSTAPWWAATTPEDDMPLGPHDAKDIATAVVSAIEAELHEAGYGGSLGSMLVHIMQNGDKTSSINTTPAKGK